MTNNWGYITVIHYIVIGPNINLIKLIRCWPDKSTSYMCFAQFLCCKLMILKRYIHNFLANIVVLEQHYHWWTYNHTYLLSLICVQHVLVEFTGQIHDYLLQYVCTEWVLHVLGHTCVFCIRAVFSSSWDRKCYLSNRRKTQEVQSVCLKFQRFLHKCDGATARTRESERENNEQHTQFHQKDTNVQIGRWSHTDG